MVAALIKEINSVRAFVRAREGLCTDSDAALVANFLDGLVKMLNGTQYFGAAEAAFVSDALKDSPYGADYSSCTTQESQIIPA